MRHIESMKSTKARRSDAEQKAFADRKGKRNKRPRGKDKWDGVGATKEYSEKVHIAAIDNYPVGVARWAQ